MFIGKGEGRRGEREGGENVVWSSKRDFTLEEH